MYMSMAQNIEIWIWNKQAVALKANKIVHGSALYIKKEFRPCVREKRIKTMCKENGVDVYMAKLIHYWGHGKNEYKVSIHIPGDIIKLFVHRFMG